MASGMSLGLGKWRLRNLAPWRTQRARSRKSEDRFMIYITARAKGQGSLVREMAKGTIISFLEASKTIGIESESHF